MSLLDTVHISISIFVKPTSGATKEQIIKALTEEMLLPAEGDCVDSISTGVVGTISSVHVGEGL